VNNPALNRPPNFGKLASMPRLALAITLVLALFFLFGLVAHQASYGDSTNATQTSSSSSIVITFDLPTAAVVTFVIVLLGLAAGLLLIMRLSSTDS